MANRNTQPQTFRRFFPSLAICLLLALVWPISYLLKESFSVTLLARQLVIDTGPGWVVCTFKLSDAGTSPQLHNSLTRLSADDRMNGRFPPIFSTGRTHRFYYPLWLLSAVWMLLLVGLVLSHLRRVQNYRPGCCQACGYDLRSSPQRCPECGTLRE